MTALLRIFLILVSILNCTWILMRIRQSKVKIEDSVFWILLYIFLIIISLCPQLVELGARITGVQSAVNFIFLAFIFLLLVKMFRMSIKISQLETKIHTLAQKYAIDKLDEDRACKTATDATEQE